jgi:hypothetical protein
MVRSGVETVRFGKIHAGYKEIWGRYREIREGDSLKIYGDPEQR